MSTLTKGMRGILASKKGTFSLLMLCILAFLCFTGHIDGMAIAGGLAVVQGVFCWSVQKTDVAAINSPNCPTPYKEQQ